MVVLLQAATVRAVPVSFALTSSQSTITLNVKNANIFGTPVSVVEQATGSLTSKYNGTLATDINGSGISFPGGSTASANTLKGLFNIEVPLAPGVGGSGASAPADYGVQLNAPIGITIPPIDLSFLGLGTLNLGTFKSAVLNTALRDVSLDVLSSGYIPRSGVPNNTVFDSTQVALSMSGNADVALGAVLHEDNLGVYLIDLVGLQGLASLINAQVPNLLTVTGNIFTNDITISLGTRLPFSGVQVPNLDASLGKLTTIAGNKLQLTVPVNFDAIPDLSSLGAFSGFLGDLLNLNLSLSGQLVGTVSRTGLMIPEPASVVTFGIGVLALAGFALRRYRR